MVHDIVESGFKEEHLIHLTKTKCGYAYNYTKDSISDNASINTREEAIRIYNSIHSVIDSIGNDWLPPDRKTLHHNLWIHTFNALSMINGTFVNVPKKRGRKKKSAQVSQDLLRGILSKDEQTDGSIAHLT